MVENNFEERNSGKQTEGTRSARTWRRLNMLNLSEVAQKNHPCQPIPPKTAKNITILDLVSHISWLTALNCIEMSFVEALETIHQQPPAPSIQLAWSTCRKNYDKKTSPALKLIDRFIVTIIVVGILHFCFGLCIHAKFDKFIFHWFALYSNFAGRAFDNFRIVPVQFFLGRAVLGRGSNCFIRFVDVAYSYPSLRSSFHSLSQSIIYLVAFFTENFCLNCSFIANSSARCFVCRQIHSE
jgi:hypothetical protein